MRTPKKTEDTLLGNFHNLSDEAKREIDAAMIEGRPVSIDKLYLNPSDTEALKRKIEETTDKYSSMGFEVTPKNQGDELKKDGGKIRMDLLPYDALEEVAKVLTYGAKKYKAHGWAEGMNWSRLIGAAGRHLNLEFQQGQDYDTETGLPTLAHAACCLLFLISYQKQGLGQDDRRKTKDATGNLLNR